jgi:hypothetical protein
MAYDLNTNLYRLSRPQLKKFVEQFSSQFPELYAECQYHIQRTYDREDHYFGSLPYSNMGEERETFYLCYGLRMQGLDFSDAIEQSQPEYRVWVR